jgi:N-methylhydantoinase B/oxoprolinase/acetone carboxylase alpha subunit
MGSYDEMSVTDRLASLSGFQEGPKNALPDGTRYEYDPVLKRTVEVTPSGERFPVILVDGKLTRDSEKIGRRKGGAGFRRSYETHHHDSFI